MLRSMLRYKCEHAGIRYAKVHERNTTRTCSCCGALPASSPRGRTGLRIRAWTCCECGARDDRDVNAARNILELGHQLPAEGIPVLQGGEDVNSRQLLASQTASAPRRVDPHEY